MADDRPRSPGEDVAEQIGRSLGRLVRKAHAAAIEHQPEAELMARRAAKVAKETVEAARPEAERLAQEAMDAARPAAERAAKVAKETVEAARPEAERLAHEAIEAARPAAERAAKYVREHEDEIRKVGGVAGEAIAWRVLPRPLRPLLGSTIGKLFRPKPPKQP